MAQVRARVLEYQVSLDRDWAARSDRGGSPIVQDDVWTPEHLLLAGLVRCTLTSLAHHAGRAGLRVASSGSVDGTVTRREEDGRFALVEASLSLDVELEPHPERDTIRELVAKAERDCFVGASLRITPSYRWVVDGEEIP